jgi:hypothetical protein
MSDQPTDADNNPVAAQLPGDQAAETRARLAAVLGVMVEALRLLRAQAARVQALHEEQAAALRVLRKHAAAVQALRKQAAAVQALSAELSPELAQFPGLAEVVRRSGLAVQALSEPAGALQTLTAELAEQTRRAALVAQTLDGQDEATATGNIPISIFLADEGIHEQVEVVVERWLATADVFIDSRREPVIGSWFRLMAAKAKRAVKTPAAVEALLTATHVADSHLVQAQDAYVTATLLQNVGPVLQALQPTKDAVVRAGALLVVKVDWVVQVYQLTAAQQAILDHRPHLSASPREIITALESPEPTFRESALLREPPPQVNSGTDRR